MVPFTRFFITTELIRQKEECALEGYDYILIVLVALAFYWDVRLKKIPNWLTAGGTALGFIYHLFMSGWHGLLFSIEGLLAAGGILLMLYFFRAIGAGDVKFFAAVGAVVGTQFVLYCMMYSIVYAGIIAIFVLLFTRTFLKNMVYAVHRIILTLISKDLRVLEEYKQKESTRFAFMYAVLPGVLTTGYYLIF